MTREVRRALERLEVPDEHEARERAWVVVQAAFAEREAIARSRVRVRPVLILAVALALVAAAISPAGEAVLTRVREAIGIERSAPALFSLPAQGRVLVSADSGSWIVRADGSRRRLGAYREASWSPRGLFAVATRENELAALEPDGDVRWQLSRPDVHGARWAPSGFRIAYLSGPSLRVVAGDGTGDRLLARRVDAVAPAWRPGQRHALAYVDLGKVTLVDADTGTQLWSRRASDRPHTLSWSSDGSRLLVLSSRSLSLLDGDGRVASVQEARKGTRVIDAAFAPRGRRFAVVRQIAGRAELVVGRRRVFSGTGRFSAVAWSPDGRWLLVAWRDADQWLFVRAAGPKRIEAVSNISAQFESSRFPSLSGWCCR